MHFGIDKWTSIYYNIVAYIGQAYAVHIFLLHTFMASKLHRFYKEDFPYAYLGGFRMRYESAKEIERKRIMCKKAVSTIRSNEKYFQLDNVKEAADLVLSEYIADRETAIPVPIVRIITDAGFAIFLQDMPLSMGGYIAMNGECEERFGNDRIIVINNQNKANRRRFTLAHEFGHYVLDPAARNVVEYYDAFEKDDVINDTEELVNRFAAELLMPEDLFIIKYEEIKDKFTDYYERSKNMADFFAVPIESVKKRFLEVGIEA